MAIGTTAAILGASAISAGVGAVASSRAASAQSRAAGQATDAQLQMFNQQREDFEPWRVSGQNALAALNFELGLGERPTFGGANAFGRGLPEIQTIQGAPTWSGRHTFWTADGPVEVPFGEMTPGATTYRVNGQSFNALADAENFARQQAAAAAGPAQAYRGFEATPGYAFRVAEGQKALERSAAARGGLLSGATMKATQRFGQGIAAEEYGTYMNRLQALAGTGQTATAQTSALGQAAANNIGQNALTAGAARGSAYLGMNNAFQGGLENAMALGARYGGWFDK